MSKALHKQTQAWCTEDRSLNKRKFKKHKKTLYLSKNPSKKSTVKRGNIKCHKHHRKPKQLLLKNFSTGKEKT